MATASDVKVKLEAALPDAQVQVQDLTGAQNHYAVEVMSALFDGKTMLEQHQMIYQALGEEMKGEVHALQIKTSTP
ncbi:MAG: stress-induced morphogen [bacterium]|jgi:stress-induced morphogen